MHNSIQLFISAKRSSLIQFFFSSLSLHLLFKDIIQHYIQGNRLSSSIFTSYCTMLCIYIKKVTLCKFFWLNMNIYIYIYIYVCVYTVRIGKKCAHAHMSCTHAQVVKCVYECAFSIPLSHSNWTGHYSSICIMGKICDHWYV